MISVLFYNPKSGNESFASYLDDVIAAFQNKGYSVFVHRIGDDLALEQFVSYIQWEHVHKIMIAGGDGTIHKMINYLMSKSIDKPIAIFPVGTANDFSKMFDIPSNINDMIAIALSDHYLTCDLGKVNDTYFVNVASFGNLVEVGHRVNHQLKNTLGVLAYYIKGIEELPKLKTVNIKFVTEKTTFEGEIFFALIMNGKSAGGFRKLSPLSDVQDGLFDILIFKKCPLIDIMPLLIQVWNGEHPKSNYIEYFQANEIMITSEQEILSDLDGEPGPYLPLSIKNYQKTLKINVKNTKL